MRLYLSSYLLGAHPEVLAGMVRGDRRGWVVANALDGQDEDRRRTDTARQVEALASLGLHAVDLDLRDVGPAEVRESFGRPDFVWVRGGNVFTLRMALARSGLDRVVVDGLAADRFVYGGFSAGACVLAPSLRGLELCDPPEACRASVQGRSASTVSASSTARSSRTSTPPDIPRPACCLGSPGTRARAGPAGPCATGRRSWSTDGSRASAYR